MSSGPQIPWMRLLFIEVLHGSFVDLLTDICPSMSPTYAVTFSLIQLAQAWFLIFYFLSLLLSYDTILYNFGLQDDLL